MKKLTQEEREEREWFAIIHKPHVQAALRRLADEARRQYEAGECEDGGFAVLPEEEVAE